MAKVGEHIGRLCNPEVRCLECAREDWGVPLFLENLMPYRQSCHRCGRVLSPGQSEAWCELFPMPHFRIKGSDGKFIGGEWNSREYAEEWAKQNRGPLWPIGWKVVRCDAGGTELQ